jgi:hypothetical protein
MPKPVISMAQLAGSGAGLTASPMAVMVVLPPTVQVPAANTGWVTERENSGVPPDLMLSRPMKSVLICH